MSGSGHVLCLDHRLWCGCVLLKEAFSIVRDEKSRSVAILEFFWWCTVSGWLLARNICFSAEAGCSQHPGSLRRRAFSYLFWRSIGMTGMDDSYETVHGISFRSYCLWEWPGVKMNVNLETVWGVPLARHVFISGSWWMRAWVWFPSRVQVRCLCVYVNVSQQLGVEVCYCTESFGRVIGGLPRRIAIAPTFEVLLVCTSDGIVWAVCGT